MILQRIQLHNFRNIPSKQVDISPTLTIILGENARGKTNLLESIHCLINGVGFRESKEEELLLIGSTESQIDGIEIKNNNKNHFRIFFQKDERGNVMKSYFWQQAKKGHTAYIAEQTRCVLFAPEQIDIITGSPDIRREYFNKLISSFDPLYKKHLIGYEMALRKRNKLLEHYLSVDKLTMELVFWDELLVKEAAYLTRKRTEYVQFLNENSSLEGKHFNIQYHSNEFSMERLKEKKEVELRIRRTVIGPQKDDFTILLTTEAKPPKDIQKYGSRSEQRLGVFWLKMNEIHFMEKQLSIHPILLLDDVFSEFDHENKERIVRLIETYQTVMTTTEEELVKEIQEKHRESNVIRV